MPVTDARLGRRSKSSRIRDVLRILKRKGGPRPGDLHRLADYFGVSHSLVTYVWGQVQDE